jgi:small-conductance mechanosensitive channel
MRRRSQFFLNFGYKFFNMIQRIQTIYLFAAGLISSLAAFVLPMYEVGGEAVASTGSMWIFFLFGWCMATFSGAILFFSKRNFQLLLVRLGMLSSLVVLALLIVEIRGTEGAKAAYGVVVPMVNIILAFLASKGIQADEKKVRSLDRLR